MATLKIDQSFVRDMLDDPDDLAILEGVIGLASAFKREVIAEGVETIEHGTALLHLGCELAQGYGIARPISAELLLLFGCAGVRPTAGVELDCMMFAIKLLSNLCYQCCSGQRPWAGIYPTIPLIHLIFANSL
jgi:hypothetical protein